MRGIYIKEVVHQLAARTVRVNADRFVHLQWKAKNEIEIREIEDALLNFKFGAR